jgi:5-methylcytosine-specific restriction enzyme A
VKKGTRVAMNRKQFIESQGATCRNWTWSWSFVNEKDKVIIFGAWDIHTEGNMSLILDEAWEFSKNGRKSAGFPQSLEHIRLIEKEGYKLKTFKLIYSNEKRDENEVGPAVIKDFVSELESKILKKVGTKWYASDGRISNLLPEEVESPAKYIEGASKVVSVNTYERNAEARIKCIEHYGFNCSVCSFDFEKTYGGIGEGYIHVHHLIPLAEIGQEYHLDPIKDLRPVCPNCHAIIHRTQPALTIEQLKNHLEAD